MSYPEGASVRVEDMGPVERAYAEAMHEGCEDGPPHPLSAHSPWSGGDLDGTEPWPAFMARLARHGLSLTATPERQEEDVWERAALGEAIRDAWHSRDMADECWIDYELAVRNLASRGYRLRRSE